MDHAIRHAHGPSDAFFPDEMRQRYAASNQSLRRGSLNQFVHESMQVDGLVMLFSIALWDSLPTDVLGSSNWQIIAVRVGNLCIENLACAAE